MSTYTQILFQIVFGAKNYTSFLTPKNQIILFNYIAGICQKKKCFPYIVGGYGNHIHIITSLNPTLALSDLVQVIKMSSNHMMSGNTFLFKSFPGWQVGFGGFSYHYSSKDNLVKYVKNQEKHHRKHSYQEEVTDLFTKSGIEYELKYLLT